MKYEPVIGLEIHVELKTKSKMFCRCSAEHFGVEPNSHTCPVCLGMPGALPVTNKQAIEYAIKAGLALGCKINLFSKFDRKHYFYPDLPKGYQISQYDLPINGRGEITVTIEGKDHKIGITRAHQEEDAGKLIHVDDSTLVDLNRAGVPLLEIVSEPDITSPLEAKLYAQKIQQIVRYTGVSDADMEKGSMRADANISLRKPGETGLPNYKVEVKNMNTFRGIEKALEFEIARQSDLLDKNERIAQETRGWDENRARTFSQRSKEEAQDYRYFPDPDLPPLQFEQSYIDSIKKQLPELPDAKRQRFAKDYGLSMQDIEVLVADRVFADWFEEAVAVYTKSHQDAKADGKQDAKKVANWMLGEVTRRLNEKKLTILETKLAPAMLSELLYLVDSGQISQASAKDVFVKMLETGETASHIVEASNLTQISDEAAILKVVQKVMSENDKAVQDYKAGKEASLQFLIGMVMRETKGKVPADTVRKLLLENL